MSPAEESEVGLADVDDFVLDRLAEAAVRHATADEVTPRVTPGPDWTPERVQWLRDFHVTRRAGMAGPHREATWAVLVEGQVVGSVRLRAKAGGDMETGVWLIRPARRRGIATAAVREVALIAAHSGARHLRATTTEANGAARAVLAALGFDQSPGAEPGVVEGVLALPAR